MIFIITTTAQNLTMDFYSPDSLVNILESFPSYSLAIKFLYCVLGKTCYMKFVNSKADYRLKCHFNLVLPKFRTVYGKGDRIVICGKFNSGRTELMKSITFNSTSFACKDDGWELDMSYNRKTMYNLWDTYLVDTYVQIIKLFGDGSFLGGDIEDNEICIMNLPMYKFKTPLKISNEMYEDMIKFHCRNYTFLVHEKGKFYTLNKNDFIHNK